MYGGMNMSGKMGKGRGQGAKPGMKKPGMSRGQAAKAAPKKMTKKPMKRGM
jgi:hypothetical protein